MSSRRYVKPEIIPRGVGLGRLPKRDRRDDRFPMRAAIKRARERTIRRRLGPALDQGETSSCVGHAWRSWMHAGPTMNREPRPTPFEIYERARELDEWEGADYDGTSVRAGAKVMRELGRLGEFVWASTSADVVQFLLGRGPVVFGVDWYEAMFEPAADGFVRLEGPIVGGHAFLCYGYDADDRAFECLNSWGETWGRRGRFRIRRADVDRLLGHYGEACGALELPIVRARATVPTRSKR